eukprot:TRINITY_DN39447_c0_g1_i1.p1 TRINITY_DN39447_c0_g1~~TRINITY_DN39447_c0_g1_i1.p1  ORF type:complete len:285 (+),score=24.50 TRINITY_DN39447_c0_g1_i1:19-873(+)
MINDAIAELGTETLGFSTKTLQFSDSACWLLSTVEALRSKGRIQSLFANAIGVNFTDSENHNRPFCSWKTTAGQTGSFHVVKTPRGGCPIIPVWQQILEDIFMTRHPFELKKQIPFQEAIRPAMGMGMKGRAEELQAYLRLIDGNIGVNLKLLTPRFGLNSVVLDSFFNVPQEEGTTTTATVLVAQCNIDDMTLAHAIAVHKTEKSGGVKGKTASWVVHAYDQLFLCQPKFVVGLQTTKQPKKGLSCVVDTTDNTTNNDNGLLEGSIYVCDGFIRTTVTGLPPI